MNFKIFTFLLTLFALIISTLTINIAPRKQTNSIEYLRRSPRQIDINLSAEHDDKEDETEIALEAIANLWRSADSKTQIEGSAKVVHNSNALNTGNTRFSGRLHVHHDYKRK
ncbi:uncharacterized protein LOC101459151 [Ceratitis capitata]|uniref:uncharacterized protein LOC101459151 n=1 Tax=Ceratitis capitata TaxID=7213 RepID=UPI0003298A1A|nr:uncharacterized protein LOC101459151 [Ceratitis capitata]